MAAFSARPSGGVVLFDLDGTLIDADHLHYQGWRDILRAVGVDLTLERYRNDFMGLANERIVDQLFAGTPRAEAQAMVDEKERRFRELATQLEPAPGLLDFLDWLEMQGVPVGVVTNAPRLNAEHELTAIRLSERFAALVIGDELAHGKPHPLPYLTGLKALGGEARRSLAFEDSISGIRAARAAGLAVVGMTTGLCAERLIEEGAAVTVADFRDPRLKPFTAARLGGIG